MKELSSLTRREFLRLAGIAAAGTALAACDSLQANPMAPSSGPIQLVYQDWSSDWFPPIAQEMLQEFHAT